MLVSAGSGLDAMVKQLFRDAIPRLITVDETVARGWRKFITRQLRSGDGSSVSSAVEFLTRVLVAPSQQQKVIDEYVQDLTGGSLQSVDELAKACAALDISSSVFRKEKGRLRTIFQIRNEIVHGLDINFDAPRRNRHSRQQGKMIGYSNILLATAESILSLVSKKLKSIEEGDT